MASDEPLVVMSTTSGFTADQLEGGIANALKAGDIEAVGDFLRVLVGVDPVRAEIVYQTLRVGVSLGGRTRRVTKGDAS